MWFNPDTVENAVSYVKRHDHSPGCRMVCDGDDKRLISELDLIDQDYVLGCPHASHEAVKMVFRHWSDAPASETIPEGRLF